MILFQIFSPWKEPELSYDFFFSLIEFSYVICCDFGLNIVLDMSHNR